MSKTKYRWWGYAKNVVRAYPELRKELNDLHRQTTTANLTGVPRSKNRVRTAEVTALKQLPTQAQKELEAVEKAVNITMRYKNGAERIEIINLMYWKQTHKLDGAALKVGYSYDRAKMLHRDFILTVGVLLGLEGEEERTQLLKLA